MRKILLSAVAALAATALAYGQTFCLQLTEVSNNGSNLVVKIEMQGSAVFNLGSSNLQFSYNTGGLSNPTLESSPLGVPYYQPPGVTIPALGEASFNLELAFPGILPGATIAQEPDWTEIGQINFEIANPNETSGMVWSYNGGTTETIVFLDDDDTQIFATNPNCLLGLDVSLPVEMVFFRANLLPNQTTQLDWQTASELNNRGFDIERSLDGRNWQTLGFVEGHGTTYAEHSYSWIDERPMPGTDYYRLRQMDFDGRFEYSVVRSVLVKWGRVPTLQVYPNPTSQGVLTVIYDSEPSEGVTIRLYATTGQLLHQQPATVAANSLDVSGLGPGIYWLEVVDGVETLQEKIIVQKP